MISLYERSREILRKRFKSLAHAYADDRIKSLAEAVEERFAEIMEDARKGEQRQKLDPSAWNLYPAKITSVSSNIQFLAKPFDVEAAVMEMQEMKWKEAISNEHFRTNHIIDLCIAIVRRIAGVGE